MPLAQDPWRKATVCFLAAPADPGHRNDFYLADGTSLFLTFALDRYMYIRREYTHIYYKMTSQISRSRCTNTRYLIGPYQVFNRVIPGI